MLLKDYLKSKRYSISEFAKLTEFSRGFISGVANGTRKPRPRTARILSRATHGAVTEKDILSIFKDPIDNEENK